MLSESQEFFPLYGGSPRRPNQTLFLCPSGADRLGANRREGKVVGEGRAHGPQFGCGTTNERRALSDEEDAGSA